MEFARIKWNTSFLVIFTAGIIILVYWMVGNSSPFEEKQKDTRVLYTQQSRIIDVKDKDGIIVKTNVRYANEELKNTKTPLLLLHGMAYNSETWEKLGTIQYVANLGYPVFAVDLPGHGKTPAAKVDYGSFLKNLIEALSIDKPIIVSPSYSGNFALPYILSDPASCTSRISGYIPVAPVTTNKYADESYKLCLAPVMVTYGEKDIKIGKPSAVKLNNFPNSYEVIIKNAGHPCYLDDPAFWHTKLAEFLKKSD